MDNWAGTWIPLEYIDWEWIEDERLKDHHFYLVAHKAFSTPIKAKYHDDGGMRHFQIMSVPNVIRTGDYFDEEYPWNDNITHWMELPDMPEVPGVIFGDRDSVAETYEKAITIMRKYARYDINNKKLTWDRTKVAFHLTCPYCGEDLRGNKD